MPTSVAAVRRPPAPDLVRVKREHTPVGCPPGPELVRVEREDHPVRLPPGLLDLTQVRVGVLAVDRGGNVKAVALAELAAEEAELGLVVARRLLGAEERRAVACALLRQAEPVAGALKLAEEGRIDRIAGDETQRIDARPPRR